MTLSSASKNSRTKNVYLLGAGFTRAVLGDIAPLTRDLMYHLDIANFPEIQRYYEESYPDIEQLLSIIDLKILHFEQTNKSLSDRFNSIKNDLVRQIVGQVDIDKLHIGKLDGYPVLQDFVRQIPPSSRILTLNYDCVLDQALYQSNRWSPAGGYLLSSFPADDNENGSKDGILLLKLHGSCNFRDAEENQKYPDIEITAKIFPGIPSSINSDPGDKPHVLVMSYVKKFHNGILRLWREAICALREAEKLIVVGCSLREEDTFLRFALYHFGMKKNLDNFFIDLVDKGEGNCKKVEEKIKKLVACPDRQTVNSFPEGLEAYLS